jgi:two-component system, chemotaxis family, protein-glutamate methylesterase/glutaminase
MRRGNLEPTMAPKIRVLVAMVSALTERAVGPSALGVMLCGMGSDGARAMRPMRDAGSWNMPQDKVDCVVFGMPRAAIAASVQPSPAR